MPNCIFCNMPLPEMPGEITTDACCENCRQKYGIDHEILPEFEEAWLATREKLSKQVKLTFRPEMYANLPLEQFQLPDSLHPRLMQPDFDCPSTSILLCTTDPEPVSLSTVIVCMIVPAIVTVPFLFGGCILFKDAISHLIGDITKSRDLPFTLDMISSDTIIPFAMSVFLLAIGITLFLMFLKAVRYKDWILLSDDGVRCFRGEKFNHKKAVFFPSNSNFTAQIKISRNGSHHTEYLVFKSKKPGRSFKMEESSEFDKEFLMDFLTWFVTQRNSGFLMSSPF